MNQNNVIENDPKEQSEGQLIEPKIQPKESVNEPKTLSSVKSEKLVSKSNKKLKSVETKVKNPEKRNRIIVGILSFTLFVVNAYFVTVLYFDSDNTLPYILKIDYRLITIVRLLTSIFAYIGVVFRKNKLLAITLALILLDLIFIFIAHIIAYIDMSKLYDEHLAYLGKIEDRSREFKSNDCDFVKVFRRRITETVLVITFHVLYVTTIMYTIYYIERNDENLNPNQIVIRHKPHPKHAVVVLGAFHIVYAIHLLGSKVLRNEDKVGILVENNFFENLLWILTSFASTVIAIMGFTIVLKSNHRKALHITYLSAVLVSTLLVFFQFIVILNRELFSTDPENDHFCNVKLTSVDNLDSIFVLMIVNNIMIALLISMTSDLNPTK